jgi:hypothetical protein
MRALVWKLWAALFGLAFLYLFLLNVGRLLRFYGIPLALTVLMAVGCVACVKLARQADDRTKLAP